MATPGHEEGQDALLPVETVQAFPVNTFIENIAVHRTGQLLVTVHNKRELIQIDPNSKTSDDIFYVSGGAIGEKGSFVVYKVDMSAFEADEAGKVKTPANISKHIDVPDALFLNGSALLNRSTGVILLNDSLLGAVYSANVHSGTSKLWIQDKILGKVGDNPMIPEANGIKIHKGYAYISNTDAAKFLRVGISSAGEATGPIEVVADNLNVDDFCFDSEGSAYLTTHIYQSLVKLTSDGVRTRLAGGPEDKIVAGTTAAAFGRTTHDQTILYVTTTGGMSYPVAGKIEPGRVLKIDVGHTADAE